MVLLHPNRDLLEAVVIFIGGVATAVVGAVTFRTDAAIVDIALPLGLFIAAAAFLAISFRRLRSAAALRKRNAAAQSLPRVDAPSSSVPGIEAPSLPRFDEYDEEGRLQEVGGIRLLPVIGAAQGEQMPSSATADDDDECAICIGMLGNDGETTWKREACGHVFHKQCVKEWLLVQKICPMCRCTW